MQNAAAFLPKPLMTARIFQQSFLISRPNTRRMMPLSPSFYVDCLSDFRDFLAAAHGSLRN